MSKNVIAVNDKDTVNKALNMLIDKRINGAPVVDKDNNLKGIIVKADIYRFLVDEGHYDTYPVESVMKKEVVTAETEEKIIDVAKKIRYNDIVAIPVVDKSNKVIGMISMEDIIDYFIEELNRV
ncbi:CBS domain-containing protein [Clostridium sp. MSJ-4]|uniref:CBS domain-containing protein n=1 Tax=Clostridium simiarum TaxID=2841506 RepID=A0ABS6EWA0_9CLOT|nr:MULTISPECIES: CBS domain-containing protein [Clostridium]MBU5590504.1 CBS domain-containing protein [Clostridium simiarum]